MFSLNVLKRRNQLPAWLLWLFGSSVLAFAVFILWANEGQINFGDVARTSLSVREVDTASAGQLIWVSGLVTTSEPLGDPPYVPPQPLIKLARTAEMYAWQEISSTQTSTSSSGSNSTTFRYEPVWTQRPQDSRGFVQPAQHTNPITPLMPSKVFTAGRIYIGGVAIDPASGLDLPNAIPLNTAEMAAPTQTHWITEFLYLADADSSTPAIGDVRLRYVGVPAERTATVFGTQQGGQVLPYFHRGNTSDKLFRLFFANRETAIAQMQTEYIGLLWFTRFIGFLAMWLGFIAMLRPVVRLVELLPFGELWGRLGSALHIAISGVLALVVSAIIVAVSFVAHRPLVLLAVLVVLGAGAWLWVRRRRIRAPNLLQNKI